MSSVESKSSTGTSAVSQPPQGQRQLRKIRLLKMVTNFSPGGTEGQVHNLVRHLDRSHFDLRMACLKKSGYFLSEIEAWGIPVREFYINSLYMPNTLMQQFKLAAYLHSEKIQIMHSYNFYANVLAIPAARMAGVPLVLASIRDRGVYLNRAQKLVQKWACGLADRILVNAESIREWLLEEGYQADKIEVIKNGIDLALYDSTGGKNAIHSELGLPAGAPLVIMLARINRQKGIHDFLQAVVQVHKSFPQARFLVVGEKLVSRDGAFVTDIAYHDDLHQKARDLGIEDCVVFTGHRSDVPALLAEATVSVLPSHSEGLSNTLLESMAAGVAIVATRVGGNIELIRDGINGLLVPPEAPVELAAAITKLLANPATARQFGRRSRQIAAEQFSMEKMVSKTEDFYYSQLQLKNTEGPLPKGTGTRAP